MKILIALTFLTFIGCNNIPDVPVNLNLIPVPEKFVTDDRFQFSDITEIKISADSKEALGERFGWMESWSFPVVVGHDSNMIFGRDDSLDKDAYSLTISEENITFYYGNESGLSSGLSTLHQLLLLNNDRLPLCHIKDKPKFAYRGMHLDVARHMFSVAEVKKYIDYLALYKFNKFHWHLTEDQGWRIEIKQYPKLQTIAAYRDETLIGHYNDQPHKFDGERYGGYYTQEEVKDIINYASARGIEVIPEIDIPGHSLALLSAYPKLGCEDKNL